MKIAETTLCSFCKYNEETLAHLFQECIFANNSWVDLSLWLKISLSYELSLTFYDICFGYNVNHPDCLINHIILLGEMYIFSCKLNEQKPMLQLFLHKISQAENLEKNNCHSLSSFQDLSIGYTYSVIYTDSSIIIVRHCIIMKLFL